MSGFEISSAPIAATHHIQRYGDGKFRIADTDHFGSVLVFPDKAHALDSGDSNSIAIETLGTLIERADDVEILVYGCGERFTPPSQSLRADLREHGIVLEWMDTGAACRTYNVLLSEGRQVAAVLVAVS